MRLLVLLAVLFLSARGSASSPSADEILQHVLASDPWGLAGADVRASAILTDKRGTRRTLSFTAASKRYAPPLSMSIVRFSAPPDLAGTGFLQIQKADGDDDRFLYLPALKRSRRISGNLRANAFMGTDFSFADLDRRDLRDSQATLRGLEKVAERDCYVIDVLPRREDSQYARLELWVRTDYYLTVRMRMYDRAGVHVKTFEAQQLKRVSGSWFVSQSLMTNHKTGHSTLLQLNDIAVSTRLPDEDFSVRALERP